jgi:phage protein D
MAMDVLSEIRAAEEKALEKRRLAVVATKDALKLAEQENAEIMDKELSAVRHEGIEKVDAARASAKAELDAQQQKRLADCEALKDAASQRLEQAIQICMEKVLK